MLQICEASRFVDFLRSGRTRPLVLECECSETDTPIRESFVVKAHDLPEISDLGLYRELLGSLLASELDVSVPRPALIELSNDFVEAVNPSLRSEGLTLRPGFGYGSKHLGSGLVPISRSSIIGQDQLIQAAYVYAFDLVVQNPDRTSGNPNCALKEGRVYAYDFDQVFSFLFLLGGGLGEPWELSRHQISYNHIFYNLLRGNDITWSPFVDRIRKLTKERFYELCSLIPFEAGRWDDRVWNHLASVIENADQLELELIRSLL